MLTSILLDEGTWVWRIQVRMNSWILYSLFLFLSQIKNWFFFRLLKSSQMIIATILNLCFRIMLQDRAGYLQQIFDKSGTLENRMYPAMFTIPVGEWRLVFQVLLGYIHYVMYMFLILSQKFWVINKSQRFGKVL